MQREKEKRKYFLIYIIYGDDEELLFFIFGFRIKINTVVENIYIYKT